MNNKTNIVLLVVSVIVLAAAMLAVAIDSLHFCQTFSNVATITRFTQKDDDKIPYDLYGGLCDPNIIGEKQEWNNHKKVITFALFTKQEGEDLPGMFLDGMKAQTTLAKEYYPDWVIQVYTVGLTDEYIQELIAYDNVEVIKCKRLGTVYKNAMLRFLALDNPKVWISISRDIDSRFSFRELMAVNQWIVSPWKFHAMRDAPAHKPIVMAGMFGMKRGLLDPFNTTMTALVKEAENIYPGETDIPGSGDDQAFLAEFIWPKVKNDTLNHDMDQDRCKSHGAIDCRDFPLGPRTGFYFVGKAFKTGRNNPTRYDCPMECIPV